MAAKWAGMETIQFVEIDGFCQKILTKNFPGVPIHEDIKTFHWPASNSFSRGRQAAKPPSRNIKRSDGEAIKARKGREKENLLAESERPFLITGGFPCQPFSTAGKRKGKEDDRAIWPEMLRVISEARPAWVIAENVAGIIGMAERPNVFEMEGKAGFFGHGKNRRISKGRGILHGVIEDFEKINYSVQAFVIPACAVGAPHRRDRIWIVGNNKRPRRQGGKIQIGNVQKAFERRSADSLGPKNPNASHAKAWESGEQAEQEGRQGAIRGNWEESWLSAATRLCRMDDGVSGRMDRVNRLKALGNSIVPQIAYQIIKGITLADSR